MSKSNLMKAVDLTLLATRGPSPEAGHLVGATRFTRPQISSVLGVVPPHAADPLIARPGSVPGSIPVAALKQKLLERYTTKLGLRLGYAPGNAEVYSNAYNGAMAGLLAGRLPMSASPTAYYENTLAAGVWAQEFDSAWGSGTAIDEVQAEGILLGSYGTWTGRSVSGLQPSQVFALVEALIASVDESESFFASQGISPPAWGGGGGETVAVLNSSAGAVEMTTAFTSYRAIMTGSAVVNYFLPVVSTVASDGFNLEIWFAESTNTNTVTLTVNGGASESLLNPDTGVAQTGTWSTAGSGAGCRQGRRIYVEWSATQNLWLTNG